MIKNVDEVGIIFSLSYSLEDETPGQYRYTLDSIDNAQSLPALSRSHQYWPERTSTTRAYRSQKQTGTVQSILVLPRCFILQAVIVLPTSLTELVMEEV